ncbi:hypothetical protein Tco_0941170 [Tanacetum coccineum]|uniref:CCHC-type domain-containing protein n=1 Tax=Tanacetum coccineum TaxID=301880 RepID=A0ABQ5DQN1_9ASTR
MKIPISGREKYGYLELRGMRQYICHIDHNLWDVIVNGDLEEDLHQQENQYWSPSAPLVSKTTKQLMPKSSGLQFKARFGSTASGDFRVSTDGGISQVSTTPCTLDVACSFFSQPTTSPQLENEDFQQIDEDDLEELDLRWQCYNCHKKGHFAKEYESGRNQGRRYYGDNGWSNAPTNESSSQVMVAQVRLGGL